MKLLLPKFVCFGYHTNFKQAHLLLLYSHFAKINNKIKSHVIKSVPNF